MLVLHKKKYLCVIAVLTAAALLYSCQSENKELATVAGGKVDVLSSLAEQDETKDTGISVESEPGVDADEKANSTSDNNQLNNKSTAAAVTTTEPVQYKEWTYNSVPNFYYPKGNLVTYTENPDNQYVTAASEQLGILASRLSASYYSKGATVFVFNSAVKNKAALADCYIIYKDTMKIEENIRKDGAAGGNKALADLLYDIAMKNKPR